MNWLQHKKFTLVLALPVHWVGLMLEEVRRLKLQIFASFRTKNWILNVKWKLCHYIIIFTTFSCWRRFLADFDSFFGVDEDAIVLCCNLIIVPHEVKRLLFLKLEYLLNLAIANDFRLFICADRFQGRF